jgi:hypothetical protein
MLKNSQANIGQAQPGIFYSSGINKKKTGDF